MEGSHHYNTIKLKLNTHYNVVCETFRTFQLRRMSRTIFLTSLLVCLLFLLLVSLALGSEKDQTEKTSFNFDFHYGEQNFLVDRDFFDDLDYMKEK